MNPDWPIELQLTSLSRQVRTQAKEITDLQQLLLQLIMTLQKAEVISPLKDKPNG